MLFETLVYAAEEGAQTSTGTGGMGEMFMTFLPLIFMFVFMYFILIRPRKKEEKALRAKISQMKVGDKVVSIGGLMGKIFKIKDDFIIMETGNLGTVDQKSYIKLEKSAIKDIESKIEK